MQTFDSSRCTQLNSVKRKIITCTVGCSVGLPIRSWERATLSTRFEPIGTLSPVYEIDPPMRRRVPQSARPSTMDG